VGNRTDGFVQGKEEEKKQDGVFGGKQERCRADVAACELAASSFGLIQIGWSSKEKKAVSI
jgi:hypothetical protein